MKLLVIASSLDLRLPYSCTPAWWQLLKGLAETGADISAIAYAGETVESLWWKAYPNPCQREGAAFAAARGLARRIPHPRPLSLKSPSLAPPAPSGGPSLAPPAPSGGAWGDASPQTPAKHTSRTSGGLEMGNCLPAHALPAHALTARLPRPRRSFMAGVWGEASPQAPPEGAGGAREGPPEGAGGAREGSLQAFPEGAEEARREKGSEGASEGIADRLTREAAHRWVMPRWRAHLDGIMRRDGPFDAVLVLTVPLNHFAGIPAHLRTRYGVPIFYYDGDLPASLPRFQGFQSGFRIYQGADLREYDGFIANSKGGADELRALGAPNVHVLYYGADPQVFAPQRVKQDIDVFFYGHGAEYREGWIRDMLAAPSEELADLDFAMRGSGFSMPLGRVRTLPYLSVAKLREYCCRSRLNLVITRQAHASVYASSTARPFELAAMGATMISNPYDGIEEWFEPGKEVIVVHSREEAVERYRWLIDHEDERRAIGERARQRLLAEHTFAHRARRLINIMQGTA